MKKVENCFQIIYSLKQSYFQLKPFLLNYTYFKFEEFYDQNIIMETKI